MLARIQQRLNWLPKGMGWVQTKLDGGDHDPKFGTFAGVFTPTVLTILGAIMYLRLGWVVGNGGLGGALLIILLAHVITICTGLSVSSVATNTRVGAGGAFAIISQSLGLEVGGSVGLPLFLAQGISVALYVLAFGEAWVRIFPLHSYFWISIFTYTLVFIIAYISTQFAARIQFIILAIVGLSLFSILLASFPTETTAGFTQTPQMWGEFAKADFWQTFAIFFPAVTGIMSGISLSGTLRDPRKSIPAGTISSISLTLIIYLALAYWLARIATPMELVENNTIMVDKARWGWTVLAGMLGATFSSALGSLVAAPRVMQALATNNILPYANLFVRETEKGEPRPAMLATAVIGLIAMLIALFGGGLDAVAGIITMFFLITYGMLNVVVLIEQTLSMVSFRPIFRIPRIVPFIGMIGCIFVMFLVNPIFSLVAIVVVFALYGFLGLQKLKPNQSDVRSGLFVSMSEWAAAKASQMPWAPERTWKPTILAPIQSVGELTGSYRFLWAITAPQGSVNALGIYTAETGNTLTKLEGLVQGFIDDGIYAHTTYLEDDAFENGVRAATQILRGTFFRPNILFLQLRPDSDLAELQQLVDKTAAYRMGIVLLARHPIMELGREQLINVWTSSQGDDWKLDIQESNVDLAILLAYQLAQNWQGTINLCTAVANDEIARSTQTYLIALIRQARLPNSTRIVMIQDDFRTALAQAPQADLNIIGLPKEPDLKFCNEIVDIVEGSCVFVRDSGDESALA